MPRLPRPPVASARPSRRPVGTSRSEAAWRPARPADWQSLYAWYLEPQPQAFFIEIAGPTPTFDLGGFKAYCREDARLLVHETTRTIDGVLLLTYIQPRMRVANLDWRLRVLPEVGSPAAGALGVAVARLCSAAGVLKAQLLALGEDAQRIALAESMGMRREGVLREHFYHAGRYQDLVMLGWTPESSHG